MNTVTAIPAACTVTYGVALLKASSPTVAPFFATGLRSMIPVRTDKVPTAGVDKYGRVYWNPDYFAKQILDEAAGVVLHEWMHLFLCHAERKAGANIPDSAMPVWNMACDCEINRSLRSMNIKLPNGALYPDTTFGFPNDETAEQYYARLRDQQEQQHEHEPGPKGPKEPPQNSDDADSDGDADSNDADDGNDGDGDSNDGNADGNADGEGKQPGKDAQPATDVHGSGTGGEPADYELPANDKDTGSLSNVEQRALREDAARQIANMPAGKGCGNLRRYSEGLIEPPHIPWQRHLRSKVARELSRTNGVDHRSFHRLHRNTWPVTSVAKDVIPLPVYTAYEPRVIVELDTSGSMGDANIKDMLSEIAGIVKACGGTLGVVVCDDNPDAPVQVCKKITDLNLTGGGGTDMRIGISIAEQAGASLCIVATDGFTPWPASAPIKMRCIALITEGGNMAGVPEWMTAIERK